MSAAPVGVVYPHWVTNMTSKDSLRKGNGSASSSVESFDYGNGIFSIHVTDIESGNTLSQDLIGQLRQTIDTVRHAASVKVLILEGTRAGFARGGRKHYNEAVAQELYQSIAAFPYPVIAAMQGDAVSRGGLPVPVNDRDR